ncbi:uncharacterized protein LAJ45_02769 [Morchella importuna]|uniref:uncharacterized protein n=1 Tax=Morchella importuna TaxID=1174673 RepID=UPI001E8E6A12|nr:uncharacterized protein LAJ45_02769 [Morchella importuna]KAH8153182.1 hypothetical protein LAJ45_02769 [Morchella importuna]
MRRIIFHAAPTQRKEKSLNPVAALGPNKSYFRKLTSPRQNKEVWWLPRILSDLPTSPRSTENRTTSIGAYKVEELLGFKRVLAVRTRKRDAFSGPEEGSQ